MTETVPYSDRQVGSLYDSLLPKPGRHAGPPFSMHHGYWNANDSGTLPEAADRLTDLLIERVGLTSGEHLLDLGCGVGQPTLRIARVSGAQVSGLSAGSIEIELADAWAKAEGLADRVRFVQGDATLLPYPDQAFDAAWAIGSLSQVADKSAAIQEIRRVLRPGGRFVVADLVLRRDMPPRSRALWAAALFELIEPQRLCHILADAGLVVTEDRDITEQTNPSWPELARLFSGIQAAQPGAESLEDPARSFIECVKRHEECIKYVGHRLIVARNSHADA